MTKLQLQFLIQDASGLLCSVVARNVLRNWNTTATNILFGLIKFNELYDVNIKVE